MKIKRSLRKSLTSILNHLPKSFRHFLIRQLIHLPKKAPLGMTVKFAETEDEFDQAFKLLQKCYVEIGIAEETLKLRATKYHTLPSATVVVAKVQKEVIATLTHVLDSPLGLPIEEHWDINYLRQEGELLAEISSLAIKKSWRHNHGLFLFLTRFTLDFAIHHLGVDSWLIVTHPKARDFYEGLLCFEPISQNIQSCEYVKGAQGFAQRLNLNKLKENFKRIYGDRPYHKNIHDFYFKHNFDNCLAPIKRQNTLTNHMTTKYFINLFGNITNILTKLDKRDQRALLGTYAEATSFLTTKDQRVVSQRCPTSLAAILSFENTYNPVRVLNISTGGVKILSKQDIDSSKTYTLIIKDSEQRTMVLPLEVVWTKHGKTHGMSIQGKPPSNWIDWSQQMITDFNESLSKEAA